MPLLTPPLQRSIVIIGKENTGKSQLIASLTGKSAYSSNFRGSTVVCENYLGDGVTFVDTPGILYRSTGTGNHQTHYSSLIQLTITTQRNRDRAVWISHDGAIIICLGCTYSHPLRAIFGCI